MLKASEGVDRSAWIDGVLEQAGTFGPRAESRGPRAQVCWGEGDEGRRARPGSCMSLRYVELLFLCSCIQAAVRDAMSCQMYSPNTNTRILC